MTPRPFENQSELLCVFMMPTYEGDGVVWTGHAVAAFPSPA